mmetsp:Transcript_33466/g.62714  ORF Transcript_33466/g.62714 Transcript_33466/m.62714 type:complete len:90 (+) Transcript_33466:167-436(+)
MKREGDTSREGRLLCVDAEGRLGSCRLPVPSMSCNASLPPSPALRNPTELVPSTSMLDGRRFSVTEGFEERLKGRDCEMLLCFEPVLER